MVIRAKERFDMSRNIKIKFVNCIRMILAMSVLLLVLGCDDKSDYASEVNVKTDNDDGYEYNAFFVCFDGNGGKCESAKTIVPQGGKCGTLPVAELAGCDFVGWYTDKNEGDKVDENTILENKDGEDIILYARYKSRPGTWKTDGLDMSYFTEEGEQVIDEWRLIDDRWYHFDEYGVADVGWTTLKGATYYFDTNGAMATGWKRYNGEWYYLLDYPVGYMAIGWTLIDDDWYFFNKDGHRLTGWIFGGTNWYYCDSSGVMQHGWKESGNATYYLSEETGCMSKGWTKIKGKIYYFDEDGRLVRDEYIDDRYVNADGIYEPTK